MVTVSPSFVDSLSSAGAGRVRPSTDDHSPTAALRDNMADKSYDYLLKILLVGDSDVGKSEILGLLPEQEPAQRLFCSSSSPGCRTTVILLDGKRVKLQLWETSGQGRFSTILRSYSRGVQGVLLVYDITNRWSFKSLQRWLKEVEEHAPGIPKILVGNRCHLAHERRVSSAEAELYATDHQMAFFELSPLCDFNVRESFTALSRLALQRNGMQRLWRASHVLSLQELCCRVIVAHSTVHTIDQLSLPLPLRNYLKSYAMCSIRPPCPSSVLGMGGVSTAGGGVLGGAVMSPSAATVHHCSAMSLFVTATSSDALRRCAARKRRRKIITPDTYRVHRSSAQNCNIL